MSVTQLSALARGADPYVIAERVNLLIRDYNSRLTVAEVSGLPSAASLGINARALVTDASSTTFAAVVAGGGANVVPVYSDGTDWRIG
jgi:hypothetical protein